MLTPLSKGPLGTEVRLRAVAPLAPTSCPVMPRDPGIAAQAHTAPQTLSTHLDSVHQQAGGQRAQA